MGIHNLSTLIKKFSPEAITSSSLSNLKGKKLGIDASIFIYKSLTTTRYNGDYLRNKEGKIVSHIIGIFYKTISYISVGAIPIFIFDGKPPESKRETINERKKKAEDAKENINQENTDLENKKLEKQSIRLTIEYINDIKYLLDLMGVSYIHPDGEAEAYASELCRIGYLDYVVSEDMDTLAFGSPYMVRSCMDKTIKRKDIVSIISLDKILEDFNMNQEEFIDMCILCGCDYCSTIRNVGCQKSYNYIQKYKTIQSLIESKDCTISDDFLERYKIAQETFQIYKNKIEIDTINVSTSNYQKDTIRKYLIETCCMSEKRVDNSLKKIIQCQSI